MTDVHEATLTAVGMLLIAAFTLTIGFWLRHGHWIWEGLIT
jgi:hypothetical protein